VSRPQPTPGRDCSITAERLALALDAASSHPTGTPNRTQVTLAGRMRAWLDTTPCTDGEHLHPMDRSAS
jgi:hypothetical protein